MDELGPWQRAAWTARLAALAARQGRASYRSATVLQGEADRRAVRMIVHAYETVPYYRETMRRLGLRPGDLRTVGELQRLPVIEPQDLQRDPEYFMSTAQPPDRYLVLNSGGSGGQPRTVFHDAASIVESGAVAERQRAVVRKLAGRSVRYREAIIESPFGANRASHEYLRRHVLIPSGAVIKRMYLSLLDPLDENVRRLRGFRPHVVEGYGSYLEILFSNLHQTGDARAWPRVAVYGSDAMSASTRGLITKTMGLPVSSAYGAVEALQIGFECEHGLGHHVNVDLVPLRVVGADGAECRPGESGEVIISNLVNRGTVLLNYRLGDIASWLTSACPCGRSLPLLSFIEGRIDDWIQSASGSVLHPQTVRSLFSDEGDVFQYQIIQTAPGRFNVLIVARHGVELPLLQERIVDKFTARVGNETRTSVSFVDAVPRTEAGKVRVVVRRPSLVSASS